MLHVVRRWIWLLPVLLCLGWLLWEQLPIWTAPQPPWQRYPELVAFPGGCAAANALRLYEAVRGAPPEGSAMTAAEAAARTQAALSDMLDGRAAEVLLPAELVRGAFAGEAYAWFAMARTLPDEGRSSVVISFISAQTGEPITLLSTLAEAQQGMEGVCGSFTAQPRGMRALLRPYLPLIVLAGYLLLAGIGAFALRRLRALDKRGTDAVG
jgi:hypothetical protein